MEKHLIHHGCISPLKLLTCHAMWCDEGPISKPPISRMCPLKISKLSFNFLENCALQDHFSREMGKTRLLCDCTYIELNTQTSSPFKTRLFFSIAILFITWYHSHKLTLSLISSSGWFYFLLISYSKYWPSYLCEA